MALLADVVPVPSPAPPPQPMPLAAVDGVALAAIHHRPAGPGRGGVLIAPAMGVTQAFYQPLARWLAAAGFHVVTFDLRGVGASRQGSLRAVDTDIVGWGRTDATAALRALEDLAPDLPLTWLGHSLGGQLVPFVPDHRGLAKIITVAAGSGYWRDNAPALRRKVWLLWYLAAPLATPLWGYFPGRALGMVGDLPRGVIRQWRRWCLDPGYAIGAEGAAVDELFARVTTPLTSLAFTDDEMMSTASIDGLLAGFRGAPQRRRRISPAEAGVARIGHFGFFKPAMTPLWERELAPELAAADRG